MARFIGNVRYERVVVIALVRFIDISLPGLDMSFAWALKPDIELMTSGTPIAIDRVLNVPFNTAALE